MDPKNTCRADALWALCFFILGMTGIAVIPTAFMVAGYLILRALGAVS